MQHRAVQFFSVLSCVLILISICFTAVICAGAHPSDPENTRPAMALVEGIAEPPSPAGSVLTEAEMQLLCQLISAECAGESFECRVAVAAVVYNRMRSNPNGSLTDAIFALGAFESITNGEVGCTADPSDLAASRLAAQLAARADPTGGALRCACSGTSAASEIAVTYTVGGMVFGQ